MVRFVLGQCHKELGSRNLSFYFYLSRYNARSQGIIRVAVVVIEYVVVAIFF